MASLLPALNHGAEGLLGFLRAFSGAFSPSRTAPSVDPALAELAGTQGVAGANANYQRRYDSARAAAVAKGVPWYALDQLAGGQAGDEFQNDLMSAANAAQLIKGKRDKEAQQKRLSDVISSLKPGQEKDLMSALPPEQQADVISRQLTQKPDDNYGFQILGNGTALKYNKQTGDSSIVRDPQAIANGLAGMGGGLSADAIDQAAELYLRTKQLPTLGRGKEGTAYRLQILNRAAALAQSRGQGGDAVAAQIAQYTAAKNSLSKLQGQQTLVGAYEKTAQKNMDLVLQQSDLLERTNAPLLNKAIIQYHKHLSDKETAPFINALIAARTEYAKVLSGATGAQGITDAARKEAEELFSTASSAEALRRVIAIAKIEMGNRMKSFDEQAAELMPFLGGQQQQFSPIPPAAGGGPAPTAGPTGMSAAQRAAALKQQLLGH